MRKVLSTPIKPPRKRGRQLLGETKRKTISVSLSEESFAALDEAMNEGEFKSYSQTIDTMIKFYQENKNKVLLDLPEKSKQLLIMEKFKTGKSQTEIVAYLLSNLKK
ncbi:MAG: hypothetical protein ACXVCY_04555 [Pseudobdellovibrionaceae bacterium]